MLGETKLLLLPRRQQTLKLGKKKKNLTLSASMQCPLQPVTFKAVMFEE